MQNIENESEFDLHPNPVLSAVTARGQTKSFVTYDEPVFVEKQDHGAKKEDVTTGLTEEQIAEIRKAHADLLANSKPKPVKVSPLNFLIKPWAGDRRYRPTGYKY